MRGEGINLRHVIRDLLPLSLLTSDGFLTIPYSALATSSSAADDQIMIV